VELSEELKRLETLGPWLETWAALPLHRNATVVAVGGGILTDMAGLAAALFLRGVAWQAWPTTLLSQVDAGLGGKTAVNLAAGKNLAGAFHHPARMVACRDFLKSLPPRQVEAGRWELVKMALLEGDLDWAGRLLDEDLPSAESIGESLRLKAEVVHRDPTEQHERRLLNLGHTLGHALEAASGHALLHGEAVGLGLLAACVLARSEGLPPFPEAFLLRLAERLRPLRDRVAPWESSLPFLRRDKKAVGDGRGGGAIHSILPALGRRAEQRLLPSDAWSQAHARLLEFLS
jgi:3-dehydroquinate synthase